MFLSIEGLKHINNTKYIKLTLIKVNKLYL